jgi:fucose permease
MVEALDVRRNARIGVTVGVVVTVAVFGFFVVIPATTRPMSYYVALAFVLAVSLAGLVTTALTLRAAIRLAKA